MELNEIFKRQMQELEKSNDKVKQVVKYMKVSEALV